MVNPHLITPAKKVDGGFSLITGRGVTRPQVNFHCVSYEKRGYVQIAHKTAFATKIEGPMTINANSSPIFFYRIMTTYKMASGIMYVISVLITFVIANISRACRILIQDIFLNH